MKKSPVPLSFIQRKAKQLKKDNPDFKHHYALDEAAKSFGFTNYKNYQNMYEAYNNWLAAQLERGADIAMEEQAQKMAEKLGLIDPIFQGFKVPVKDLINTFKTTKHKDEAIQSICEKESSLKQYLELYFLKNSLEDGDWDLVTDAPYHIPEEASINSVKYKFGKDAFDEPTDAEVLCIEGDYELVCKIMFEHTQEDIDARSDGFFDDQVFIGSFELTIDRDKNIELETY